MKNLNKLAIALAVFGCVTSASTFAQSAPFKTDWYLAPSVNVMNVDRGLNAGKTATGVGMRFGAVVTPTLDIQFGPTYSRTSGNGNRYTQGTVGADALFMFSRSKLRPFVLVGAGAEYDRVERSTGNQSKSTPYINAGVGFQYGINDRLALQADVRRVRGLLRSTNQFGMGSIDNNYLTVGMNFYFGK